MSAPTRPRVFIETLGCQMNVYDSELLERRFAEAGYETASCAEEADVILVNGCSIRRKAEMRAWSRLARYRNLGDEHGRPLVVLCGCVGSRALGGLGEGDGARADVVAGCGSYDELLPVLDHLLANGAGVSRPMKLADSPTACYRMPRLKTPSRLSAFVSISRGCDSHCAYCVVPSARGPHRSRPLKDIVAEVSNLADGGTREITLLGQNVNIYKDRGAGFVEVLEAVQAIPGIWRVRFTSPHPKDMSPDVLRAVGRGTKICEHLHLPLQAGSDPTLSAMARGYTTDEFRSIVEEARSEIPGVSISTDLMVGFPGETEEHYNESLKFVQEMEFDAAFTFKYSSRPGTAASRFPDQVPEDIKGRRLKRLIDLQNGITDAVNRRLLHTPVEVLVEGRDRRNPRRFTGRTRTHKIVSFEGESSLIGTLVTVRVESTGRWMAGGRLVNNDRMGGGETS